MSLNNTEYSVYLRRPVEMDRLPSLATLLHKQNIAGIDFDGKFHSQSCEFVQRLYNSGGTLDPHRPSLYGREMLILALC